MPKVTHISGRRWFQRTYGNTYHSATLHLDDGTTRDTGQHYGYDEQYLQTAVDLMRKEGLAPPKDRDGRAVWQLLKQLGITHDVADVARERDL